MFPETIGPGEEDRRKAQALLDAIPCREIKADGFCENPLVSVLVLTYGHEKYIKDTLESILAQKTSFDYEIIIAEDCSPDRTREIALEYQKKYPEKIRLLYSDANVGMIPNLYRLYSGVRGKFFAVCEGDDYWLGEDKLQKQVDCLIAHPDAVLCHTDYDYFNMLRGNRWIRNRQIKLPEFHQGRRLSEEILLDRYRIKTPTVLVRSDAYRQVRDHYLLRSHPAMDNYLFFLLSLTGGAFCYIPESHAVYRQVPGSATAVQNVSRRYTFMRRIHEAQSEVCREFGFSHLCEALNASLFPELWQLAVRCRDHEKIIFYGEYLDKTGKLSPLQRFLLRKRFLSGIRLECYWRKIFGYLRTRRLYKKK